MDDKARRKRVSEEDGSPATRQKGSSAGVTLDDIRLLLQQQTQVLKESQSQEMEDLKTATFKELGVVKKEMRRHGDYIGQLREQNENIEARLLALENSRVGPGSDAPSSSGSRPNLLVLGGWPQDTARDDLLRELGETLTNIGVKESFSDIFCTGPRRGYALALVKEQPGEIPQDLKRRLITIAQQIRYAAVQAPSMENGKTLRASLGKTKQERLLATHVGKTKRLILTMRPGEAAHVEADYSASNVWLRGQLIASASRPKPNNQVDSGPAPRSWIDITLASKLLHADPKDMREAWLDLVGERYQDPPRIKELYCRAKRSRSEIAWKEAHKARRKAQEDWRRTKLEKAASCNWTEYRSAKQQGGAEWSVSFAEAAGELGKNPKRWTTEHFKQLFRQTAPRQVPRWNKEIDSGEHFTMDELKHAVAHGKKNKAVGEDLISFELLQGLIEDEPTARALLRWMENLRCGADLPQVWLRTIVTLLPKTDNVRSPAELRPISLGSAASKVFGTMLLSRTRKHIQPIGAAQCAHSGRQTADYLHAALRSFSLDSEWKLGLNWCRIDIRKAFDTVGRDRTLQLLRDRLPACMYSEYRCWERLFHEGTAILRTPWGDTTIPQTRGIRQGSVESPFLFAIAIEQALSTVMADPQWPRAPVSAPDLPVSELLYMDDLLLWSGSKSDMQKKYAMLKAELQKWGLHVNAEKTKYYRSPHSLEAGPILLESQTIENGAAMPVFGVPLSVPVKPGSLMDTGIAKATSKFYSNKHVFLARAPLKDKLKLFSAVVTGSALWYSCAMPPSVQAMGALNTAQLELVSKLAGFRRRTEESWLEFRLRSIRGARQLLVNHQVERWSTGWLKRYWDYKGHIARALYSSFFPHLSNEEKQLNKAVRKTCLFIFNSLMVTGTMMLVLLALLWDADAKDSPAGRSTMPYTAEHAFPPDAEPATEAANSTENLSYDSDRTSSVTGGPALWQKDWLLPAGHLTQGAADHLSTTSRKPEIYDTEDNSALQARTWLMLGVNMVQAFEQAWSDGEHAPDWFWDIVDMGGDMCRAGVQVREMATLFSDVAAQRQDTMEEYYMQTEPIRNRIIRAWEVVCAHYFTCDLPLPHGLNAYEFARLSEESLRQQWHRAQLAGRQLVTPRDHDRHARSRSPARTQARQSHSAPSQGTNTHTDEAGRQEGAGAGPDEEADITALVADKWLLKPKPKQRPHNKAKVRHTTTETVILRAPWKRGGNPPLRARPAEPAEPSTPPPDRPAAANTTCPIELDDDEKEEVVIETNTTARDEAVEVWQALFEFEPREAIDPSTVPVVPQSTLDNIVETLLDKPESEYQHMVMASTYFLGRVADDVYSAMERARALRARLRDEPSGSKGPDSDLASLMQKSLGEAFSPAKPQILYLLKEGLQALSPGAAIARARQLQRRLKDHDGPLTVDRALLDSALLVYAQGEAERAEGDRYLCEFAWVAHWWAILEGRREPTPVPSEVSFLEKIFPEDPSEAMDPLLAQQLQHEEDEEAYQRGLEAAVAHHMERTEPEPVPDPEPAPVEGAAPSTSPANLGYQWKPPTKRLCLGICLSDGRQNKAWDYELDMGDQVDIHIRARQRVLPGCWTKEGRPVPYERLPEELRASFTGPSASSTDRHLSAKLTTTRVIGDYAVRDVGGDTFLQFFRICAGLSNDTLEELNQPDTAPLPESYNMVQVEDAGPTQLEPELGGAAAPDTTEVETAGPEGETVPPDRLLGSTTASTLSMSATSVTAVSTFPDPYYDGAAYWQMFGHEEAEDASSDSGS
ncbi:unnamed protein product [Symbiodinium sp. KB8]|nr:unnamed protein product [Symbiodinium sp. KB8]